MRIGFVGCGAIGSCYASYLSRKHEVCVLDTYAPVIESIKKNGILLDECAPGSGTGETVSFRPAMATTDPKEIGVVDLLIVFVHYQYLEAAVRNALPMIDRHTMILCLQNGLGNYDEIAKVVPEEQLIIGSTAFAHESGIHQAGMLKNRNTYEIMTPQAVGRKSTDIVIGKHSGRNAVRTRLEELGYNLDTDQVNGVVAAMKELADKKARIHDEDLEALVFSEVYRMRIPDRFRLSNICVQTTMGSTMPTTAAVVMQDHDEEVRLAGFGVGPIDAAFNVISQICGTKAELEKFSVNAITGGTDAQGEVSVHLRDGKYSATGRGSDLDIIVASAKAYVDALNRLEHKEKDVISYKQNPVD